MILFSLFFYRWVHSPFLVFSWCYSDLWTQANLVTGLDLMLMKLTLWSWRCTMMSLLHQLSLVNLSLRNRGMFAWLYAYGLLFLMVASASLSGNYDIIQQPKNISEFSRKNVPFYLFIDEETEAYMKNYSVLGDSKRIGLWRIIVVRNVPYSDARRNGKVSLFWLIWFILLATSHNVA